MVPAAHVWEGARSLSSGCACQRAALASQEKLSPLPNRARTPASAFPDTAPCPTQTAVTSKVILAGSLQRTAVCKHKNPYLYRVLLAHFVGQGVPAESRDRASSQRRSGTAAAGSRGRGPALVRRGTEQRRRNHGPGRAARDGAKPRGGGGMVTEGGKEEGWGGSGRSQWCREERKGRVPARAPRCPVRGNH